MNADCEVKKLKDLVKKLERQNQHLRYKTGKLGPHRNSANVNDLLLSDGSDESYKSNNVQQTLPLLDDSIDESYLKSIESASDTCWLFSLGKDSAVEDRESLESWLRHDLEHPPTAALAHAKRNILNILEASVKTKQQHIEPIVHKSPTLPAEAIDVHQNYADGDDIVGHESHALHHVRHMPLPSHTSASVHGLVPNDTGERFHRSLSPARSSRQNWESGDRMHRNQSPARGIRQQSPARHTRQQSPARLTRQQSPSRLARQHMPLPSQTGTPGHSWASANAPDSHYSMAPYNVSTQEKHSRRRSPSPAQRISRSPSPVQRSHRSPSPGQRNHRTPSPSYRKPFQPASVPMRPLTKGSPSMRTEHATVQDKSINVRRIPGPSTPRTGRSSTNLRKDGALTPRMTLGEKLGSDRSPRNQGLYSSGVKSQSDTPNRKPGVASGRGAGGRQLKQLQATELRGAVSSEELYAGSLGDGNSDRSRRSTPRRSLPRPSRATRNQYSNINHEISKYGRADSVRSLELRRPDSIQSDETASEASDVWKDGEFF